MKWNTDEEIEKYSELLGEELSFQFAWTRYDVFELRSTWRTYKEFFGTNEERFNLVFEASPVVAQTLERALFEQVLVGIRRLTDPASARGGKQSVTIKSFAKHLPAEESLEIKKLVSHAERKASFARDWVNRRIAHTDKEYRDGSKPLEIATRKKVEESIDAIAEPIRWLATKKCNFDQITHPLPPLKDETIFLRHLFEGKISIEEKKRQVDELIKSRKYNEALELRESYPEWLDRSPDRFDKLV